MASLVGEPQYPRELAPMVCTSDSSYTAFQDRDELQEGSGKITIGYKDYSWLVLHGFKDVYREEWGPGEESRREDESDNVDAAFLNDAMLEAGFLQDDILLLRESDIPGASLNGKAPSELNVVQLKRWLACCGAPTTGRKPELIER